MDIILDDFFIYIFIHNTKKITLYLSNIHIYIQLPTPPTDNIYNILKPSSNHNYIFRVRV